jgi:hypothetical protein
MSQRLFTCLSDLFVGASRTNARVIARPVRLV